MSNRPRRASTFVFGVCHQPRALFVEVIVPPLLSFVNEVLSCLGRFLQGFLVRLGRCFIEVCPTASGVFYKAERPPWRVFDEVVVRSWGSEAPCGALYPSGMAKGSRPSKAESLYQKRQPQ